MVDDRYFDDSDLKRNQESESEWKNAWGDNIQNKTIRTPSYAEEQLEYLRNKKPETRLDQFDGVLREMRELTARKGADYGDTEDGYRNIVGSTDWGIEPWVSALLRANDKIRRLQEFAKKGTLENEGVEDSLIDLANYAVIALILFREKDKYES